MPCRPDLLTNKASWICPIWVGVVLPAGVTIIRYLARKERTVPVEWLNPMFLARSPVLE